MYMKKCQCGAKTYHCGRDIEKCVECEADLSEVKAEIAGRDKNES